MTVTIEISHYPLVEDYEEDILLFLASLRNNKNIIVITNAMSTQVKGEYDELMPLLIFSLKEVFNRGNMSSTVIKIIPRELPIEDGLLEL